MQLRALGFCLIVCGSLLSQPARKPAGPRYKVPEGFTVETVARPEETGSLINLTFDSLGRLVVSKERSGPTLLLDQDGDGHFETQKLMTDKVTGLQGMWFEGRTLYAVGRGPDGAALYRMEDKDADDTLDTSETLIRFTGPMGEHGPHAIRRGPDGSPYLLTGNHTGIPAEQIDPASPHRAWREDQFLPSYPDARGHARNVRAPGAAVWRLDFARRRYTMICAGFRNPYDIAFNREGELFTFDSDMEWDIGMPWYREVRSVHCVPGGEYGWRTGSGKWPNHYLDGLPPLREVGRGSPVGVESYHHYAYPRQYWDSYLEGDWSRGRILITGLERQGASYKPVDPSGDFVYGEPLNVTDLEVGPDGNVYFVNGGRDTEGGVYRVVYKGAEANRRPAAGGVEAALHQPQPLSSWGWEALFKLKEASGEAAWGAGLEKISRDPARPAAERIEAVHLLQRLGPKPRATLLGPLSEDPDAAVRAAAVYVLGQHGSPAARKLVIARLKDADAFVRRRALESLVRMGLAEHQRDFAPVEDIYALLNDGDRFVRFAARLALERTPRSAWENLAWAETNPNGAIESLVALARISSVAWEFDRIFARALELMKTELSKDDLLRLLRAFQLSAIRAEAGAPAAVRAEIGNLALARFPSGDRALDGEYARILAYCQTPGATAKILAAMPQANQDPEQQIHYVYCLRNIESGWTAPQRAQLIEWFAKAQKWRGGASFPGFIEFLFRASLDVMTPAERQAAYAKCPDFAPSGSGPATQLVSFERRGGTKALSPRELSEYLLYDPMILRGDVERGKKAYVKAQCHLCHRFGDLGQDYGPDLTTIASRFSRKDLIEAVIYPSKTLSDLYPAVEIVTTGGKKLIGPVVAEDAGQVTVAVMGLSRQSIPLKEIKSRAKATVSTMPEGLLDNLSTAEAADLLALLESGKEKAN